MNKAVLFLKAIKSMSENSVSLFQCLKHHFIGTFVKDISPLTDIRPCSIFMSHKKLFYSNMCLPVAFKLDVNQYLWSLPNEVKPSILLLPKKILLLTGKNRLIHTAWKHNLLAKLLILTQYLQKLNCLSVSPTDTIQGICRTHWAAEISGAICELHINVLFAHNSRW